MQWKYYNHAAVPTTAPHEEVDLASLKDGSVWKLRGETPLLARWTTDWDCGHETSWWFIIKDAPFNLSEYSSKQLRKKVCVLWFTKYQSYNKRTRVQDKKL